MCFTVQLSRFLSFWQLWYFIISFSACQELFSKVFYQSFGCAVLFFDSHTRLSHLYCFVKNFLKLFFISKDWCLLMNINDLFRRTLFFVVHSNFYRISYPFSFVNNFFRNFFCFFDSFAASGERGIWTLAPLLTTYSLSRGAPSASWVFLHNLSSLLIVNNPISFRKKNSRAERVGFEPTRPCGQTVFKTASLWPLRYLSVPSLCQRQVIYYHVLTGYVKTFQEFFSRIFSATRISSGVVIFRFS